MGQEIGTGIETGEMMPLPSTRVVAKRAGAEETSQTTTVTIVTRKATMQRTAPISPKGSANS